MIDLTRKINFLKDPHQNLPERENQLVTVEKDHLSAALKETRGPVHLSEDVVKTTNLGKDLLHHHQKGNRRDEKRQEIGPVLHQGQPHLPEKIDSEDQDKMLGLDWKKEIAVEGHHIVAENQDQISGSRGGLHQRIKGQRLEKDHEVKGGQGVQL